MNKLVTYFLFFSSLFCFSQNETSNWYFGDNNGLNFNLSTTSLLKDNNIYAPAAASSVSDKNGKLLMYTNGAIVLDNEHKIIPNGFSLGGEFNNYQSTIIIPKPNSINSYYIFTCREFFLKDIFNPIAPGLYYNEIDILNKKVVQKRIHLIDKPILRLTAVQSEDKKNIWIIALGYEELTPDENIFSQALFKIKVDKNGVSSDIETKKIDNKKIGDGAIKFSPNGKRIAFSTINSGIKLYGFDPINGKILSNLNLPRIHPLKIINSYGLEFSPNSNYLYSSSIDEEGYSLLHQIDLNIPIKYYEINKTLKKNQVGSLQLSFNGKIYHINNKDNISVINKPYKKEGNVDYTDNIITLSNLKPFYGLPNFIQSHFRTNIKTEKGCINQVLNFEIDTNKTIKTIFWDYGDGSKGFSSKHTYTSSGFFMVEAIVEFDDNQKISISKEIEIHPLPELVKNQKLIQCDVNNDGIDYFNLFTINYKISSKDNNLTYYFYENQKDAEQDSNRIINPESYQNKTNPQSIYVRAINLNDCYSIGSFDIESSFVNIDDIPPITVCENSDNINNDGFASFNLNKKKEEIRLQLNLSNSDSLNFYSSLEDAQTTNNKLEDLFVSKSTQIWLRVDNSIGCGGIKPIDLIVNHPIINLQDNYTICISPSDHPPVILNAGSSNDRFEWKDENNNTISTNSNFTPTRAGTFSLTVYKTINRIECSNSKKFTVQYPPPPEILNIEVNVQSETDNSVYISVDGDSSYEFSLDNTTYVGNGTSHSFNNIQPGIATIYIRDTNKCESPTKASASIIGYPKFLTPNADGFNDYWKIYGVSSNFFKEIDIKIFNRFGKVLHIMNDKNTEFGWNGTYNNIKLPSNDYWFHAKLKDLNDNVIDKKGHFTLKRN